MEIEGSPAPINCLQLHYLTLHTVYTIQTALHCFTVAHMPMLVKVRMLLEWADGLLSKMLWTDRVDTP